MHLFSLHLQWVIIIDLLSHVTFSPSPFLPPSLSPSRCLTFFSPHSLVLSLLSLVLINPQLLS